MPRQSAPPRRKGSDDPEADRIELPPLVEAALEAGEVALWRLEIGPSGRNWWSAGLDPVHGLSGSFEAFLNGINPADRPDVVERIERALVSGSRFEARYRSASSTSERWLETRGAVIGGGGLPAALTGICQDITEEQQTERRLEQKILQLEAVASLGRLALAPGSLDELFNEAVRLVARVLDVELAKILELQPTGDLLLRAGVGWSEGLVGKATVSSGSDSQAGFTLGSDLPVIVEDLATETRFTGPPLLSEHGVVSGMSVVIRGCGRRPFGVFGAHTRRRHKFTLQDVSFLESAANIVASAVQHSQEEQRRNLLLSEMRHRTGNLMAIVLSICGRTAESATTVQEFSDVFRARLMALARSHAVIMQGGWTTTSLLDLVETVLSAFREQVSPQGRDVDLVADTAFPLSMVLHELATNASKHGSLSAPEGTLGIQWHVESQAGARALILAWRESLPGRQPQKDDRRGFGSRLITTIVETQLSGSIERSFGTEGLTVLLRIPL